MQNGKRLYHLNNYPKTSVRGRYDTLKLIPWWEQERVAKAHVMVVGVGALGNEILKNLALIGVGHILLVDFDVVEAANLTRSVLFRGEDIGQPKAKVAAQRLKEINPDVKIAFLCADITTEVGLGIFHHMDVVITGVDNFAARIFVNRACWKAGTPWINGGIQELTGEVHVYIPGRGACYECNLPAEAYKEIQRRFSCTMPAEEIEVGKVPTTPTIASIIAAIQVQEALKLLHKKKVAGGSGLVFNGMTNKYLPIHFSLNERCYSHSYLKPIRKLKNSTSNTTFGELLNIASDLFGSETAIELDFDIALKLTCTCGFSNNFIKRLDKLSAAELRCPKCDRLLQPVMTSIVSNSTKALLDKTLSEVGIPPWHIVTLRNAKSAIHFEFSNDRDKILNYV